MENFDIMINEETHTLIDIEANTLEEAKVAALLKYLNKDLSNPLEKNTSVSVTVAERPKYDCIGI